MVGLRTALLVGFFFLLVGTKVDAVTVKANLTASQESPPNASTAMGSGTVTINDSLTQFIVAENFSDPIHDFTFPSGERRGQIFAVLSEPTSVSLLGVGLLVAGYICRRQFRKR